MTTAQTYKGVDAMTDKQFSAFLELIRQTVASAADVESALKKLEKVQSIFTEKKPRNKAD